ncbi:MAG: transposase, partial [Bacilli bacterium]|nr:transposase [Bacilli bacterium]
MGIGRPKWSKNVMRSPEEKERMVLEALENGSKSVARRHEISWSLLRTWVRKYLKSGIEGLKS